MLLRSIGSHWFQAVILEENAGGSSINADALQEAAMMMMIGGALAFCIASLPCAECAEEAWYSGRLSSVDRLEMDFWAWWPNVDHAATHPSILPAGRPASACAAYPSLCRNYYWAPAPAPASACSDDGPGLADLEMVFQPWRSDICELAHPACMDANPGWWQLIFWSAYYSQSFASLLRQQASVSPAQFGETLKKWKWKGLWMMPSSISLSRFHWKPKRKSLVRGHSEMGRPCTWYTISSRSEANVLFPSVSVMLIELVLCEQWLLLSCIIMAVAVKGADAICNHAMAVN